jgi:hypothetical protein
MKMSEPKQDCHFRMRLHGKWGALSLLVIFFGPSLRHISAQTADQAALEQKIQQLTDAMAKTQAQLEESQRELATMRQQLSALQREMSQNGAETTMTASAPGSSPAAAQEEPESTAGAIQDLRERQAIVESEIATQAQSKVESESKYPVKLTGLLLMNGFVNTTGVDMATTPSLVIGGSGSAGASVRQTILGVDASGPHLFGARSFADLRMDFFAGQAVNVPTTPTTGQGTNAQYAGYFTSNSALLRLRTSHAGLDWGRTRAFFALDRPIISPDSPTSLTAVAVPALAWSGNLWTWNPQAVLTQEFARPGSAGVEAQAALIDVGDAPLTPTVAPDGTAATQSPTSAEQSSRPGVEARIALIGPGEEDERNHLGVGGFFAEHDTVLNRYFDSWAGTLDARVRLIAHLEFAGNFYRGAGLGGLGAGGYKDFAYAPNTTGSYYFRALDDVGGWAQLKEKATERLEFNASFGLDNVDSGELRHYYSAVNTMAQNLARNRTFTSNVVYSPSAYLLFSLEYRHLVSTPVVGAPATGDIIGIAAGYKF